MALRSGTIIRGYRPELDGVRAIAVCMVISWHAYLLGFTPHLAGFIGVDLFFVLSGYLITMLLTEEHRDQRGIALGRFYARRALRLLPALFLMLAVGTAICVATHTADTNFGLSVAAVLLYIANWKVQTLGILTHTWTLAIEEQFYLLWPLALMLMLALARRTSRLVAAEVLLVVTAVAAAAQIAFHPIPKHPMWFAGETFVNTTPLRATVATYLRSTGLLLGCAIGLGRDHLRWARNTAIGAIAGVGAAVLVCLHARGSTLAYRAQPLAIVVLVAIVLSHLAVRHDGPMARALAVRPLAAVGRVSYGLYLFHVPVIVYVAHTWGPGIRSLFIALGITAVVTTISYVAVERPALRLKKRFAPPQFTRASTAA